jgi:hypothetical protein
MFLVGEYKVSRNTVREALRRLRADGVVVAERGRRPPVATPAEIEQPVGALYCLFASVEGFRARGRRQGRNPHDGAGLNGEQGVPLRDGRQLPSRPSPCRTRAGSAPQSGRSPAVAQLQAPGAHSALLGCAGHRAIGCQIVTEDTVPVASARPLPVHQGRPKRGPDFGPTGRAPGCWPTERSHSLVCQTASNAPYQRSDDVLALAEERDRRQQGNGAIRSALREPAART